MPHRGIAVAISFLFLPALLAAGCGGGGGNKTGATATKAATRASTIPRSTPTAALTVQEPTRTPAPDIRQEDLSKVPSLSSFLSTAGGSVDTAGVTYADLTGDGIDDAIVPVSSGEGGTFALFGLSYQPEGLIEILRISTPRIAFRLTAEGQLQVDVPQFSPTDPLCCPSQLQRTTYRWDGTELAVADQQTVPAASKP